MPSHFSCIGLPISTGDEFQDYFEKAYDKGEHLKVDKGIYLKWKVDAEIELWAQLNNKNEAIGLNPHFFGQSRMKVLIQEKVNNPKENEMDGSFYAQTNPQEGNEEGVGYPFVFDVPDMGTYGDIKLPQIVEIQLSAFAHEIRGFESEQEYFDSQEGEMKFAVESFIPSGLFSPNEETTNPPVAQAIFSGRIMDTEKRVNSHTHAEYVWARVNVMGDEIDVVTDPEAIEGKLVKGGILSGSFWLTGRIAGDFVKEEKSFWKKLMNRK